MEDTMTLNVYVAKNIASKYIKQNVIEPKGEPEDPEWEQEVLIDLFVKKKELNGKIIKHIVNIYWIIKQFSRNFKGLKLHTMCFSECNKLNINNKFNYVYFIWT